MSEQMIIQLKNKLVLDFNKLGPMKNWKLVKLASEYMAELGEPEVQTNPDDDLPSLKENFKIDKDAKAVSKEIYDYLKMKYGVAGDGAQDVYRLLNKECPNWKYDVTQRYDFESKDKDVRVVLQIPITSEEKLPN